MGTATGWNHPAQISRSLVTHWPTLLQVVRALRNAPAALAVFLAGVAPVDGTNNCWFPLARKWPTWKWTWIWILYGKIEKNVRVTSDGIHAEIHEIWTCVAPAAPPLFHAAVNPCLHRESAWNWSCNSVNLGKSTVTWMRRHYVFTVISRWSTFSSTVNVCNINCVIWHALFLRSAHIVAQSISCGGVSVLVKSWRWSVKICRYRRLYLCLPFNNLSKLVHKSSSQKAYSAQCILRRLLRAVCQTPHVYIAETWRRPQPVAGFTKVFRVLFKFERKCQ